MVDFEFDGEFGDGTPPGYEYEFTGEFSDSGYLKVTSKSIELNNGPITTATILIDETRLLPSSADFIFELSNDGGTTWNVVSLNTTYTFTSSGQDLRYRITANTGSSLNVRTSGVDKPIVVSFTR